MNIKNFSENKFNSDIFEFINPVNEENECEENIENDDDENNNNKELKQPLKLKQKATSYIPGQCENPFDFKNQIKCNELENLKNNLSGQTKTESIHEVQESIEDPNYLNFIQKHEEIKGEEVSEFDSSEIEDYVEKESLNTEIRDKLFFQNINITKILKNKKWKLSFNGCILSREIENDKIIKRVEIYLDQLKGNLIKDW